MWIRIAAQVDMACSQKCVAMIRRHDDNQSQAKHWVKNHQNVVKLLSKIWRLDTLPDELRRRARRQLTFTAIRLAERLVSSGEYADAYRVMQGSMKAGWVSPRYWPRFVQCLLLSTFNRKKMHHSSTGPIVLRWCNTDRKRLRWYSINNFSRL